MGPSLTGERWSLTRPDRRKNARVVSVVAAVVVAVEEEAEGVGVGAVAVIVGNLFLNANKRGAIGRVALLFVFSCQLASQSKNRSRIFLFQASTA